MEIGDLITYVDSSGATDSPRELGIITKDDHYENENYILYCLAHSRQSRLVGQAALEGGK